MARKQQRAGPGQRQMPPPRAGQRPLPGPSNDADSVFQHPQFPHVYLDATTDNNIMARKYWRMVQRFLSEIAAKSASENGTAQYLYKGTAPGPMCILPKTGYLILVLRPAPLWGLYQTDENGDYLRDSKGNPMLKRPLKFLFRLKDFYLLGYFNNTRWRLFKDVKLKGVICGSDISNFTMKLPYDSSYRKEGLNVDFNRVPIGDAALKAVFRVLSDTTGKYKEAQIHRALAAITVTCCEATKRRSVCYRIMRLYQRGQTETVDSPLTTSLAYKAPSLLKSKELKAEEEELPSRKFNTWSNDCKKAWGGLQFEDGTTDEEMIEQEKKYWETLRDLSAILPQSS